MLKRIWKEIKKYPNYQISNYGEIVNIKTERQLNGFVNSSGTLCVSLTNRNGIKHHGFKAQYGYLPFEVNVTK